MKWFIPPSILFLLSFVLATSCDRTEAANDTTTEISNEPTTQSVDEANKNNKNDDTDKSGRIEPVIPPSSDTTEHLEALNWLVGDWVDQNEEENSSINYSYKWNLDSRFLIQNFVVTTDGENELEGRQVIGWDPSKNKFRSWIFDSKGGFGESLFSKIGDSIYANMDFTLPDGRKMSATQIYTKIDKDNYTFSIVGRDLEGSLLPDLGPFKIVRKQ